ncbi:class A beta-lactamase [Sphingosinicella sp. BN140058]|uniref:class A beta-lactamase n=1 Tax=Sphingosinicella sp. BN140058 TaxID=1892855 RepID=UPI001011DA1D|nr:class A beta-lactamase [Sphingosinicella sp. BN140058]QAY75129.1 class A beta-lactamase [Sphingosinicella sp. BN140058]
MAKAHRRPGGRTFKVGRKGLLAALPLVAILAAAATYQPASPVQPWSAEQLSAQRALDAQIRAIGNTFNGDIGIAVKDVQTGWRTAFDGNTYFPQQSVSKFWVALTALDKADRGELSLTRPVTLTKSDITLFHQPVAAQIGPSGYTTTITSLMTRALQQSDNTCNDAVLWRAGGPEAVRAFLRNKGISGIRFGPGERLLQSEIAGLEWKQAYASNRGFYAARDALPLAKRRAAFEKYIASPMDGATPLGIVDALARLKRGELLSPASTDRLLSIMSNTKTGPQRLKGGLGAGWRLAHKTGTGQVLGSVQAGYNDIGILTAPDGHSYAVAVMIRRTSAPLAERMAAMQRTVRSVIAFHDQADDYRFAGSRQSGVDGTR